MKRDTLLKHSKTANDVMYYIYKYIDTDINIDELASELGVSRFHLQRLFKDVFGRNIYESIKSIRLQKAANLLLSNRYSTISDIAYMCGYASHSSFNKVFRDRFGMTPKGWRSGGFRDYSDNIISESEWAKGSRLDVKDIKPRIVRMPEIKCVYIRHKGYGRDIMNTWQKLYTWMLSRGLEDSVQVGLHHDNPALTPLAECGYIACAVADVDDSLPTITIPSGIFAKFNLEGRYGDVLKFINWVYNDWFPESGYEATTLPAYAVYEKNHFLSEDERFVLSYYIPVTYQS